MNHKWFKKVKIHQIWFNIVWNRLITIKHPKQEFCDICSITITTTQTTLNSRCNGYLTFLMCYRDNKASDKVKTIFLKDCYKTNNMWLWLLSFNCWALPFKGVLIILIWFDRMTLNVFCFLICGGRYIQRCFNQIYTFLHTTVSFAHLQRTLLN